MATRTFDVTKLQRRVAALERKMKALEAELSRRDIVSRSASVAARSAAGQLWTDLLEKGIVRLPTPAELALDAEWQALPEAEKQATRHQLRQLKLTPTLSEVIHQMRAGWYPDRSEWVSQP